MSIVLQPLSKNIKINQYLNKLRTLTEVRLLRYLLQFFVFLHSHTKKKEKWNSLVLWRNLNYFEGIVLYKHTLPAHLWFIVTFMSFFYYLNKSMEDAIHYTHRYMHLCAPHTQERCPNRPAVIITLSNYRLHYLKYG